MTIYNTASLPPCRANSWNSLSAPNCLFSSFRRLPEQTRVNWFYATTVTMVILVNLIHGLSLTLHAEENNALQFIVYICRQCFALLWIRTLYEMRSNKTYFCATHKMFLLIRSTNYKKSNSLLINHEKYIIFRPIVAKVSVRLVEKSNCTKVT